MCNFIRLGHALGYNTPKPEPDKTKWVTTEVPVWNMNPDHLKAWLDLHFGTGGYNFVVKVAIFEILAPRYIHQVRPAAVLPLVFADDSHQQRDVAVLRDPPWTCKPKAQTSAGPRADKDRELHDSSPDQQDLNSRAGSVRMDGRYPRLRAGVNRTGSSCGKRGIAANGQT